MSTEHFCLKQNEIDAYRLKANIGKGGCGGLWRTNLVATSAFIP